MEGPSACRFCGTLQEIRLFSSSTCPAFVAHWHTFRCVEVFSVESGSGKMTITFPREITENVLAECELQLRF